MEVKSLKCKRVLVILMFLFFIGMMFLNSGAAFSKDSVKIIFDVPQSAQITAMDYFLKPWKGADRLHFKITLKNQSPDPKRFKVTIFLDEGPSGAILFPRKAKKGKEPLIPAQKKLTQTLPLVFEGLSSSFTVKVEEF